MNDLTQTKKRLIDELAQLLADTDRPVPADWVREMETCFPCFTLPETLYLKRSADAEESEARTKSLENLALRVTDKQAFVASVDMNEAERSRFYPAEAPAAEMTTDDAIDTFLQRYGSSSPEEEALLEKLIFNPVAEYAGVLEASLPAVEPADEQDRMIDAFLHSSDRKNVPEPDATVAQTDDIAQSESAVASGQTVADKEAAHAAEPESPAPKTGLLSESLAKIFIKQRRYSRAYEILSGLSLNYPEKSIYFADQLRFLQKLIINQQSNQKEHT